MKRLDLDSTWRECLAMWKWISRQCLGKSKEWCANNVDGLKKKWLYVNGIGGRPLSNDCFFCEHAKGRTREINGGCFCPARKIDKEFDCMAKSHDFSTKPRAFYAELKRLNKIRLA